MPIESEITEQQNNSNISADEKLAIQQYVGSIIKAWLTWLGIANATLIVGALIYILFILPNTVSNEAINTVSSSLSTFMASLVDKRFDLAEKSGQITEKLIQIEKLTTEFPTKEKYLNDSLKNIQSKIKEIEVSPAYNNLEAITALNKAKDAKKILVGIQNIKKEQQQIQREFTEFNEQLISVQAKSVSMWKQIKRKTGNNGTVSCDLFCSGKKWKGWSGTCIGAKLISGKPKDNYVSCGNTPGLGNVLVCTCSQFP